MDKKQYKKQQWAYSYGYIISALLTLGIYLMAMMELWSLMVMTAVALGAAALQLITQSHFFLHLRHKKGEPWWLSTYLFAWLMLLIVAIGSLWIMHNMNYNMGMTPEAVEQDIQFLQKEYQKGF